MRFGSLRRAALFVVATVLLVVVDFSFVKEVSARGKESVPLSQRGHQLVMFWKGEIQKGTDNYWHPMIGARDMPNMKSFWKGITVQSARNWRDVYFGLGITQFRSVGKSEPQTLLLRTEDRVSVAVPCETVYLMEHYRPNNPENKKLVDKAPSYECMEGEEAAWRIREYCDGRCKGAFATLAKLTKSGWLLVAAAVAVFGWFGYRAIDHSKSIKDEEFLFESTKWACIVAVPLFLVVLPLLGSAYEPLTKRADHYFSTVQSIEEYSSDGETYLVGRVWPLVSFRPGDLTKLGEFVGKVGLAAFLGLLIPYAMLLARFLHYQSQPHPATEMVSNHLGNKELNTQKLIDSLKPDMDESDPAWKIRNRTKQAKDLADLYHANADLGEEAIEHEKRKARRDA